MCSADGVMPADILSTDRMWYALLPEMCRFLYEFATSVVQCRSCTCFTFHPVVMTAFFSSPRSDPSPQQSVGRFPFFEMAFEQSLFSS